MNDESAIIVPVAEVEPIVGEWRLKHDPAAKLGVPAHITLLYPFRPSQAAAAEINRMAGFFAQFPSFDFSFTEVRRFTGTAYLYPDKARQFIEITTRIVREWPDCLPYKGEFSEVVPHLTVAHQVETSVLDTVEQALRAHLPIQCCAREAQLLFKDPSGVWSRKASFAFADQRSRS
jgi:2'-5' RNA ligase